MNQLIVFISSIILGIALGAMIIGFQGTAQDLTNAVNVKLDALETTI